MAWQGHPNLRIVDSSTDFQGKIGCVLAVVAQVLGIPEPPKSERAVVLDAVP
jgi:hypothetical protein